MTIYLIGMMGSGKSYLGTKLADALDKPFADLDERIEKREGKTIAAIFKEHGQPYFRKTETETLRLTQNENALIAPGGGAPCHDGNMNWMNRYGLTIYLQAHVDTLMERLQSNGTERPMLGNLQGPELKNYLTNLLAERQPFYEEAGIIYDTTNQDEDKVINDLVPQILERSNL